MKRYYDADLAYVHDVGFGEFARRSAPGILLLLPPPTGRNNLVVDLGCGSGIWAQQLIRAGYQVLGFDLSPAMIKIARRRAPAAEFRTMSYLDAELPPCVAVTSMGECFNYAFDKRSSPAALKAVLRRVYNALLPGGMLVFDIAEPGRGRGPKHANMLGADWAVLVERREDSRTSKLSRSITTFRKIGTAYRRSQETHVQRLYKAADIARMLRGISFSVRIMRGYGQYRFPRSLAAIAAKKHR